MKCKQHFPAQTRMALILLCHTLYGFQYGNRTIGGGGEQTTELWRRRENNRIEEEEGKQYNCGGGGSGGSGGKTTELTYEQKTQ